MGIWERAHQSMWEHGQDMMRRALVSEINDAEEFNNTGRVKELKERLEQADRNGFNDQGGAK